MNNIFLLRAKWTRSKRKLVAPPATPLVPRPDDIKVGLGQYFATHLHMGRLWTEQLWFELQWFVQAMRGELPPEKQPIKNYTVLHITLPKAKYLMALEALTTRLGVKPEHARPIMGQNI